MGSTITSFAFSILGLIAVVIGVKDGVVFDMRMLCFTLVAFAAIICSWLARIENSIDRCGKSWQK